MAYSTTPRNTTDLASLTDHIHRRWLHAPAPHEQMAKTTSITEFLDDTDDHTRAVKEYLAATTAELSELHYAWARRFDRTSGTADLSALSITSSGIWVEGSGLAIVRERARLIDDLLRALFTTKMEELDFNTPISLVALGGYGRHELNIGSDIDLMLLYPGTLTPAIEELTQRSLYLLWDTGLDMGFSIRTVEECMKLAAEDQVTLTALLDMRLVMGSSELFTELEDSVLQVLGDPATLTAFIEDKLREKKERHSRFGDSVYILEPNIKEGEGGLRDLHLARWVTFARTGDRSSPSQLGLLSVEEQEILDSSFDFLLWVRNELHLGVGRKSDQLTFDHQERIAQMLGYKNTEHSLAVEAFMQYYYRHATNLNRHSSNLLYRAIDWGGESAANVRRGGSRIDSLDVDENYSVTDGNLTLRALDAYSANPGVMIHAFEHAQSLGVYIDQTTRDMISTYLSVVDDAYRADPDVAASFIRILRSRAAHATLKKMRDFGFLEAYIPEFKEIVCKVQHDRYHVYTVDAHTLFAVRELDRLATEYRAEHTLMASLFDEVERVEVLYMAVLCHDIGKARGKGHAEKGAELVPGICARLGLSTEDIATVRFLVKNHLLLADTAQYRDLHDEKLIIEFAQKVGDIERLNLLYLLTFADVRAVGPDVWSQWKGALFQELYFKALTVLERGSFEVEEAAEKRRTVMEDATRLLVDGGMEEKTVERYLSVLPERYFLATGPELVAGHVRLLDGMGSMPYSITVRQDTFREYTEFIIATTDVHGLFAMISGVMAANAVNILGTQIYTLADGTALDIIQVKSSYGDYITDRSKISRIEEDLSMVLTGQVKVDRLVAKRRKTSILDRKATPRVRSSVVIDNEVSDAYTIIDVRTHNRLGLLYDITSTLAGLGLYIDIAKISTKGDEVADIFYVKDIFGQKIFYKGKLDDITKTLHSVLEDKTQQG